MTSATRWRTRWSACSRPVARPLRIDPARKPHVILVVGVNGTGKTTTIGKLAARFRREGKTVMLAAGDTFRAAAIDQLKIWGERTGAPSWPRAVGADASGLAYDALSEAKAGGTDVLLLDTAGRLQNKEALMAELEKVVRVLRKLDPSAPHDVLLVLDATTGQNALGSGRGLPRARGRDRPRDDKIGWHGAWRHPRRHRRQVRTAGLRDRCWRRRGRPATIRRRRVCPGDRSGLGRSDREADVARRSSADERPDRRYEKATSHR